MVLSRLIATAAATLWVTTHAQAAPAQRPMKFVVSLADQTLDVFVGDTFVERHPVSTGMAGHETPTGVFSILEKRRIHHSNIYSGAPMPFMQRITWSGIALHAGRLPGYPASHGCIRLPDRVAASLFQKTTAGVHVIVARNRLVPTPIDHEALPKPAARLASVAPAPAMRFASLSADQQETASDAPASAPTPALLPEPAQSTGAEPGEAEAAPAASESPSPTPAPAASPETEPAALPVAEPAPAPAAEPGAAPAPAVGEVYSDLPVRVLLTRRSGRERLMDVQKVLQELGYDPGEPDGYMGSRTGAAIGAFQETQGLPKTRAMSDDLVVKLYAAAGKGTPPTGHLYVRQDFKPVFDMPVAIVDPQAPLGTHVLTAIEVDRERQSARWTSMELERPSAQGAGDALARFVLPDDAKQRLARMLTQGSSIVITDRGIGPDTAPKGTDFIVVTNRRM